MILLIIKTIKILLNKFIDFIYYFIFFNLLLLKTLLFIILYY